MGLADTAVNLLDVELQWPLFDSNKVGTDLQTLPFARDPSFSPAAMTPNSSISDNQPETLNPKLNKVAMNPKFEEEPVFKDSSVYQNHY